MSPAPKTLCVLFSCLLIGFALPAAEPLKVYILAGQSNMEGHAKVETLDYLADDPATAPLLAEIRDADGSARVCEDVHISYLTGSRGKNGEGFGQLTTGYGSRRNPTEDGGKIGPELTFGLTLDKAVAGPILLIKTAWGGKSLHTDFRSPSAGPYPFNEREIANYEKQKKDMKEVRAAKEAATGHYYRLMIAHVKHVLGDIGRIYPGYDAKHGYEIAGFVWFQAWNDMVASGVYPDREKPGGYDRYSECLAHFIRDVRKDLSTSDMRFVIGVVGVGGPLEKYDNERSRRIHGNFRAAMAAPAALPEFQGNVVAVQTAPFWASELAAIDAKRGKVRQMRRFLKNEHKDHANKDGTMSPQEQKEYIEKYEAELITADERARWEKGASNAGYHYLGCGKTMALIGKAFAEAMLSK